jgi:stage II sporulation protein E
MELDLMSGVASFIKSGAAPTYIARQGTVYKVSARTMPVGIIKDADARITKFDTKKGDVIVMISDGVTQGKEECPWLFDLLRTHAERTEPERLADLIVKYAKGEGVSDDISVLIIQIRQA